MSEPKQASEPLKQEISRPAGDDARLSDYNPFFEALVEPHTGDTADRLIGMLAYCRYKRLKCAWVKKFRTKHNRYPNREDVQAFIDSHFDADNLQGMKAEAEKDLYRFAEWYSEKSVELVRDQLQTHELTLRLAAHEGNLQATIERCTSGWRSLLMNVLSNVVFALILLVLAWAAADEYGNIFRKAPPETKAVVEPPPKK